LFEEELLVVRPPQTSRQRTYRLFARLGPERRSLFALSAAQQCASGYRPFFQEIGVAPHVVMEADDTEAIKRLVESGFGIQSYRNMRSGTFSFFQKFRIHGHTLKRSLALATARTDCPRKLTESIASFLSSALQQSQ